MTFAHLFFYSVAAAAVVSAILMVTRRNPVKSVLFLIVNFFSLAVLYLFLQAQFVAIIQVLVYAGAIMVLFLFVIMLLNLGDEEHLREKATARIVIGAGLAAVVLAQLLLGAGVPHAAGPSMQPGGAAAIGTVEAIGRSLYVEYLFPLEAASIVLLAAMVGVIVLAKKKFG